MPVKGAMYVTRDTTWPSSYVCIWRSLVQVQATIHAEIQEQEKELNAQLTSLSSWHPFSWLSLLREGLMITTITGLGHVSACFLCAVLGRPPLTAVPYPTSFNGYSNIDKGFSPISDISLFLVPDREQFSFCYANVGTTLYNLTLVTKMEFLPLMDNFFGITVLFPKISLKPLLLRSCCACLLP